MIIWGTKGREKEIGTGTFYCPRCDTQKPYTRKKVSKYFTLFFIPLFEIKELGEYLQCSECNTTYKPEVLNFSPLTAEQREVLKVKQDLASGTPYQMAQTKLINSGVEPEKAALIVNQASPDESQECDQCHLTYVSAISKCSNCGGQLAQPIVKSKDNGNNIK